MQWRAVSYTAQRGQYLRDAVVGKHGDLVNVPELSVSFAVKTGPDIRHQDLGPFEEADRFASAFKPALVVEAIEVPREQVDQPGGGPFGGFYALREAAAVFLQGADVRWRCVTSLFATLFGSTYFV